MPVLEVCPIKRARLTATEDLNCFPALAPARAPTGRVRASAQPGSDAPFSGVASACLHCIRNAPWDIVVHPSKNVGGFGAGNPTRNTRGKCQREQTGDLQGAPKGKTAPYAVSAVPRADPGLKIV